MLIDWFTVIAQAVNFLILVWLLKRLLYKPVLDAIDAREKRITSQLEDAAAKKAEAARERDDFLHKNAEFEKQRDTLMSKAASDAKGEGRRLLDDARKQAEALQTKLEEASRSERDSLCDQIARRTQDEVFAIARKTLSDLAAATLEERMTEVFIDRLRGLNGADKGAIASFLEDSRKPALVRSAFDLPQEQRTAIEHAIKEILARQTTVQFETAPALVSGIELVTDGYKVTWNIADYLASLEKSVREAMDGNHANES